MILISTPRNPPRIIEYTVEGQTYQVESLIQGGKRPAYDDGEEVTVVYLPQNPKIARVAGEEGHFFVFVLPNFLVPLVLFPLLLRESKKGKKITVGTS